MCSAIHTDIKVCLLMSGGRGATTPSYSWEVDCSGTSRALLLQSLEPELVFNCDFVEGWIAPRHAPVMT